MARINGSTNSGVYTYYLNVTETSYSIENNTSNLTVEVYMQRTSGSYPYNGGNYSGSVTVNGETKSYSGTLPYPSSYSEGQSRLYATLYFTVGHNDDGSKTVSISSSYSAEFSPTSGSASGSMTLTTIPRASEISSVSTANIGSAATITVNRKSSSFTHTITYSFGSLSGTIVTKSSSTSISWTIPTTFYAQIPNSKTGSGTLTITTYSGNTQIGSSSTKSFSVSTSESGCKPTVSGSVVDSNSTTTAITGNNSILIAGYSTANVSYTATPKNSASIKTITVNNNSAYSGTSSSAVSGTKALTSFNSSSINIVAKDSRGYSTTKTLTAGTNYTLVNYVPLTFNGSVTRDTPTGNALKITFSGKFYGHNIGNSSNTLTLTWKWRRNDNGSWTSWNNGGTLTQGTHYTINTSNNTYSSGSGSSQTAVQIDTGFNYQKEYEIAVYYNDLLVNTSKTLYLSKGQPIINWDGSNFNVNGNFKINNTQMQVNASSTISGGIKVRLSGDTLYITTNGSNP